MRLDHLLSREPVVGNKRACRPVVVGVWVCFLVPACVYCPGSGVVGVGACFGLGVNVLTDEHTVGFTFNTV